MADSAAAAAGRCNYCVTRRSKCLNCETRAMMLKFAEEERKKQAAQEALRAAQAALEDKGRKALGEGRAQRAANPPQWDAKAKNKWDTDDSEEEERDKSQERSKKAGSQGRDRAPEASPPRSRSASESRERSRSRDRRSRSRGKSRSDSRERRHSRSRSFSREKRRPAPRVTAAGNSRLQRIQDRNQRWDTEAGSTRRDRSGSKERRPARNSRSKERSRERSRSRNRKRRRSRSHSRSHERRSGSKERRPYRASREVATPQVRERCPRGNLTMCTLCVPRSCATVGGRNLYMVDKRCPVSPGGTSPVRVGQRRYEGDLIRKQLQFIN